MLKVIKQTPTELHLENDQHVLRKLGWIGPGLLLISVASFLLLRIDTLKFLPENVALVLSMITAGGCVTAVIVIGFVFMQSYLQAVSAVSFDKTTQQIRIETREIWHNWRIDNEKMPLDLITAVHFKRAGRYNLRIELAKNRWDTIYLTQGQDFNGEHSRLAETISDFLNVPLLIFMNSYEPIVRQPGSPSKEKDPFYDI